jgi:NADH-quinone oxidoreductase subunit H
VRAMRNVGYDFAGIVYWVAGAALAILLLSFVVDVFRGRKEEADEAARQQADNEVFDPMAGGFPVPPLPGQTLPPVPRRRSRHDPALVGPSGAAESAGEAGREGQAAQNTDGKEADGA